MIKVKKRQTIPDGVKLAALCFGIKIKDNPPSLPPSLRFGGQRKLMPTLTLWHTKSVDEESHKTKVFSGGMVLALLSFSG